MNNKRIESMNLLREIITLEKNLYYNIVAYDDCILIPIDPLELRRTSGDILSKYSTLRNLLEEILSDIHQKQNELFSEFVNNTEYFAKVFQEIVCEYEEYELSGRSNDLRTLILFSTSMEMYCENYDKRMRCNLKMQELLEGKKTEKDTQFMTCVYDLAEKIGINQSSGLIEKSRPDDNENYDIDHTIQFCPKCHQAIAWELVICPFCGNDIREGRGRIEEDIDLFLL